MHLPKAQVKNEAGRLKELNGAEGMFDKSLDMLIDAKVEVSKNITIAIRKVPEGNPLVADKHQVMPSGFNAVNLAQEAIGISTMPKPDDNVTIDGVLHIVMAKVYNKANRSQFLMVLNVALFRGMFDNLITLVD